MSTVEIFSRGKKARILEMKVYELGEEFKDEIEVRSKIEKVIGTFELIVIAIIGSVTSHFIIKLIEKLFDKEEYTKDVKIQIVHQEFNTTFNLPKDKEKCIEHFKQHEED